MLSNSPSVAAMMANEGLENGDILAGNKPNDKPKCCKTENRELVKKIEAMALIINLQKDMISHLTDLNVGLPVACKQSQHELSMLPRNETSSADRTDSILVNKHINAKESKSPFNSNKCKQTNIRTTVKSTAPRAANNSKSSLRDKGSPSTSSGVLATPSLTAEVAVTRQTRSKTVTLSKDRGASETRENETPSSAAIIDIGNTPSDDVENETYSQVVRKRKQRSTPVIGSGVVTDASPITLKVAERPERRVWLHVWRLDKEVTEDQVVSYLTSKKGEYRFTCDKLQARGEYSSFKIGAHPDLLDELMLPDFWPTGTAVSRFFHDTCRKQPTL